MSIAFTAPFVLAQATVQSGWLLALAVFGTTVYSFGAVVYNINQVSYRQRITPDRLLGRMNATMRFLVWGTMPLGGLIGGVLGQTVGVRETVWIGAICGMFAFLPVFFSPLRNARELPEGPGDEGPGDADSGGPSVVSQEVPGDLTNPEVAIP
jgi:MFS family permease